MRRRATDSTGHAELTRIVRGVRRRWRLRLLLRGLALLAVVGVAATLLAALAVQGAGLAPRVVLVARVGLALLALALLVGLLLLPAGRRVTDEQVALYLEEREPALRAALISALAAGEGVSSGLARRTVETALARCRAIGEGRGIELRSILRSSGVLALATAVGLALFLAGPDPVRVGARALFLPLRSAEAAVPAYRVSVTPGDASVPRGADLQVVALPTGFRAERVELRVRVAGDSAFQRVAMLPRPDSAGFEVRLFDLARPVEYYVEAGPARSPVFRVSVVELPYVERIELELRFPAYTGLPPQRVTDGGDVAVPAGTVVRVRAVPTMPVAGGRLAFSSGAPVPLERDTAGALRGGFRVLAPGLYHVELRSGSGGWVSGSPQYLIDVLPDEPPTVSIAKPGRDTRVTSVDEVFVEARAEDDFGVRSLELVYSVNGAPERSVPLYGARPLPEVTAGHTLYLEELGLQPGDFVSYYARATDVGPGARRVVTSDIYFLEVRPFGREYRQADEAGGGAGAGGAGGQGGGEENTQLSRRQRELISATFNLARDRDRTAEAELRESIAALAEAQETLRRQALTLAQRLGNRGEARDSALQTIARELPLAAGEMVEAVARLRAAQPAEALPAEQRALLHLQRAEAAYREVQVSLGPRSASGNGSAGSGASAEDLADLFALELDKLGNQYETVQRGERQQAREEADEVLDRVRELARRQERVNERLRDAMASQQLRSGAAAEEQRRLAEETERVARQLERLSRERGRSEMMEGARRLREAAESMRRAAAEGRSGGNGEARAALDRLHDAGQRLGGSRAGGLQREADDAVRRAERLAAEQEEIEREMGGLAGASEERAERARRLLDRKERQAQEVTDLERQLDRLASETRREEPDASRRLQAAAESIRRNQLQEKIRASRAATRPGSASEYGRRMEEEIGAGLDELRRRTQEARGAMAAGGARQPQQALDRMRSLVRGMESIQERTRQAGESAGRPGDPRRGQGRAQGEQRRTPAQGQGQGQGRSQRQGEGAEGGTGRPGRAGEAGGREREGGAPGAGGGGGSGPRGRIAYTPGTLWGGADGPSGEAVRQLRREVQERLTEARELRQRLAQEGMDVGELDRAIADLRRLGDERAYADWGELQHLQAGLLDRLRQFEFGLRRTMTGEQARRLFLSGSGEVPPAYRELVERYYRQLSERPRR